MNFANRMFAAATLLALAACNITYSEARLPAAIVHLRIEEGAGPELQNRLREFAEREGFWVDARIFRYDTGESHVTDLHRRDVRIHVINVIEDGDRPGIDPPIWSRSKYKAAFYTERDAIQTREVELLANSLARTITSERIVMVEIEINDQQQAAPH